MSLPYVCAKHGRHMIDEHQILTFFFHDQCKEKQNQDDCRIVSGVNSLGAMGPYNHSDLYNIFEL